MPLSEVNKIRIAHHVALYQKKIKKSRPSSGNIASLFPQKKMVIKKPILVVLASFVAGIICGRYLLLPIVPVYFILLLLVAASLFFYLRNSNLTTPMLFSCVFFLGLLHFTTCYYPCLQDVHRYASPEKRFQIKGKVATSPRLIGEERKRVTFLLEVDSIREDKEDVFSSRQNWQDTQGLMWVNSFYPYKNFRYGDVVLLEGKISLPQAGQGGSGFNWREYLSFQGVFSEVSTGRVEVLAEEEGNLIVARALGVAAWMRGVIDKALPHPYSAALKGVLLGDKDALPENMLASFRRTGTAHILVVSGLHVGLLFLTVVVITRAVGLSPKFSLVMALPFMIFYAFLTGLRPPVMRASLMAGMAVLCAFLDRQVPLVVILCLAAFILLAINPLSLFTVSFQLSFLAVGGIVCLTPYLRKKIGFLPPSGKRFVCASVAAQLSLLPLLAFYFGQFPLVGFLANLLMVPLLTPILSLGFVSLVLTPFTWWGAQIFFNTNWLLLKALLFIVNLTSFSWAPDIANFFSPRATSPPVWVLVIYYPLLFFLPYSSGFVKKGQS